MHDDNTKSLSTLLLTAACLARLRHGAAPAARKAAPATPARRRSPLGCYRRTRTAAQPAAVRNMISNCYSCHGTDGRSPGAIPSLTGKNAEQALLQLKEFKSGQLAATVMTRHAKGYTDAETRRSPTTSAPISNRGMT